MVGSASYSIGIDRENGTFDFQINYTIDAYNDPETGEYFPDTSWTVTYGEVGSPGGGTGGYGSESETVDLNLGLHLGEEVINNRLTFSALNTFSGVSISYQWNILEAAYATGDKVIDGAAEMDLIISGSGNDTLRGFSNNDVLDGGPGADLLDGGGGADYLDGGAGSDIMIGGPGDDSYVVQSGDDIIVEAVGGGLDTVLTHVSYTLPAEVEQLFMMGLGELNATGNASANRIEGNGSANVLRGLGGDDLLKGHDGADTLYGGQGADILDGGPGDDRLDGGAGDDTYEVDSAGDEVVERAGGGVDMVHVSGLVSYTLGAQVENLIALGDLDFHGVGNALSNNMSGGFGDDTLLGLGGADILLGNYGDDVLEGGVGADNLQGGEGFDSASYAGALAGVSLSLTAGVGMRGEALGDTYTGIEGVIGSNFNDVLDGDAGDNRLLGGAGDDQLIGGGGHDWLIGGAGADDLRGDGDDGVSYAGSVGAVSVNLQTQSAKGGDGARDRLQGFVDAAGGAGDDSLTGSKADNWLFGDAGADHIKGGGGNDTIEGGSGEDRLAAGAGDDLLSYASSSGGVMVNLQTGAASGADAQGDSFNGFEGVLGSAFDDQITGDRGPNPLFGGGGDDTILAGAGADTIDGGAGNDSLDGGSGIDTLSYATAASWVSVSLRQGTGYGGDNSSDQFKGFENLRGGEYGDALYGDDANNAIDGGNGSDYIDGSRGDDRLTGGLGDDIFLFLPDSGRDTITDFHAGSGWEDVIYLNPVAGFHDFADIMAAAVQVGADTVITFDANTQLILEGVDRSTLAESDFLIFY